MKQFLILISALAILTACNSPQPEVVNATPQGLVHPEWSKNASIYEANIRQHTAEGTFSALTTDLERISTMGVKILWLMPVHPIGEVNRKGTKGSYYSVKDYKAVNPEFGTMADFDALVAEAHRLGMKVIIDWVANHSAFDNVWTETHLDWYNLDSLGKLQPPVGTDWWDVADLNFDNPEMRAAMIDAMAFWLSEAGVDGFRCDVAGSVPTDFWNECAAALRNVNADVYLLAEAEQIDLHENAFNAAYGWEFLHIMNGIAKGEKTLADIDSYMATKDEKIPANAYRMYFTTNHDENSWNGTEFVRFGEKGNETYAVLAFTIDGMPLVYSGQEAAMNHVLAFFEKDTVRWGEYRLQEFYTKLLKLHTTNEALWNGPFGGDFKRINSTDNENVYAFMRTKGDHQVVTICNLSDKTTKVTFENLPSGAFSPLFDNESLGAIAANGLELAPFGYHIFHTQ